MRKALFWFGWVVLALLPVLFFYEVWAIQDLPKVQLWKWGIPVAAILLIFFSRNRDDVLKHHVV
jgi:hypothetical protein